jgi:hypothetical protein
MNPPGDLYLRAREILRAEPGMGKKRLAMRLGVKTPTSRRFMERFRGETQGHSSDPMYQRVRQLKEAQPDWGAVRIATELSITKDHAKLHLARWLGVQSLVDAQGTAAPEPGTPPSAEALPAGITLQDSVSQNMRDLCYRGARIQTLAELLVYAQVDTSVWEVERSVAYKWEVGARNPATGETLTAPLFQLKAWLRRKVVEQRLAELKDVLLAEFKKAAPVRIAPVSLARGGDGMLEISLMDLHYGKLCWGPECGRDYDPDIAERMFCDALEDLLAKGVSLKPARILFPCGNDFLHTDILGRTTTAGTPQDSGIGWKRAFTQGWRLLAKAIERLRLIAPVDVPIVSGNHEEMGMMHLGEVLGAYFHSTAGVTVDNRPTPRKYVTHGKCLLGLTHGDKEPLNSLGLLLACERPTDWANSRPAGREWHIGHLHSKRSLRQMPCADVGGVLVRVIPSLCPPDAWHASKGYGSKLAAEAYYWDPEYGVTATFTHSPV